LRGIKKQVLQGSDIGVESKAEILDVIDEDVHEISNLGIEMGLFPAVEAVDGKMGDGIQTVLNMFPRGRRTPYTMLGAEQGDKMTIFPHHHNGIFVIGRQGRRIGYETNPFSCKQRFPKFLPIQSCTHHDQYDTIFSMKLTIYLGNPGTEYKRTRHNAGFLVCDEIHPSVSWQKKFHGLFAQDPDKILKPQTFMNLSGISVGEAATFYHLKPEEILVVHDDLELPFGTVRLQRGGGLQGHNGLRSIKEQIGSDQFARCRIGIGRPKYGNIAQYVLTPFSADEEISLGLMLPRIRELLEREVFPSEFVLEGLPPVDKHRR